jgi:hypothetical protein
MYRYLMTYSGYNKVTTGTPGGYYVQKVQYISTIAPWTTGTVTLCAAGTSVCTPYVASIARTGYDNRTPNGLSGVISLVRPRLVHTYVVPQNPPGPIVKRWSAGGVWQIDVHFSGPAPDGDGDGVEDSIDNCSEATNAGQDDTDCDGYGNLCDADYDQTGTVGFPDFGQFVTAFGSTDMEKCHNEPIPGCIVGFPDFGSFVVLFGSAPGPSGTTACP